MPKYIVVLAGGCINENKLNCFVEKRLDKCFNLYTINSKIIILGGGTYHKPPILDYRGMVKHESSICAEYLINKGVLEKDIYKEWSSFDTVANGFFFFLQFEQPLKINNINLVTCKFQMQRTKVIFNYFKKIFYSNIVINFVEIPDTMENSLLKLRTEREYKSKIVFQDNIINKINTISEFIEWFYTKHKAYRAKIQYDKIPINSDLKKTY